MKKIIIFIGVVLISLLGLYKYNEWKTISELNRFNNTFFSDHIELVEISFNLADETQNIYQEAATKSASTNKDIAQQSWDELWVKLKPITKTDINNNERIIKVLSDGKQKNEEIKKRGKYVLFTHRPTIITYTDGVDGYIDANQKMTQYSQVNNYFILNNIQIQEDIKVLADFDTGYINKDLTEMMKYVADNFHNISSLEKYSRTDFEFDNENIIRENLPESYDYLIKAKKYFNSYYAMMKDMATGDSDSASSEWNNFNNNRLALMIDVFSLDNAKRNELNEVGTKMLLSDQKIIGAVSKLNKTKISYPLLKTDFFWSDTLVKCDFILTSSQRFYEIMEKYPESTSFDDLNLELDAKGVLLTKYQYDSDLFQIENENDVLKFTCSDEINHTKYVFKLFK